MKADHILQADLLDIIFNNRNKQYGAYVLRKEYDKRIYKAITITFLIIAGLSAFSLLNKPAQIVKEYITDIYVASPPKFEQPEIPLTPPATPSQPRQQNSSGGSLVFSDSSDHFEDSLPPINEPNIPASGPGIPGGPPAGDTTSVQPRAPIVVIPIPRNRDEVVDRVDVMPEFPGGLKELRKFLERNLREPDQLQQMDEGQIVSVKVTFIVGYDGKLKGFNVTEDGGEVFNKEVIRVLKKMPDWKPGIAKGENVSVYYTIPVKFMAQ